MFRLFARLGWRLSIPVVLILLGVLFYAGGLVAGFADYMPFNTYSDGWRMGMLSKVSLRGNPLFKSVEGELLMGNDSSATVVKEADQVEFANPWEFSAARSQLPELQQIGGKTVAIHYRQLKLQLTRINGDTDYRVLEVKPVDLSAAPQGCGVQGTSRSTRSDGERVGYLTKVSDRGNLIKTYEVILQLGNAGNQFLAMSILDNDIYKCAQAFLQSGMRVRVNYKQSLIRNPTARDTTYDIVGIWPAPKEP